MDPVATRRGLRELTDITLLAPPTPDGAHQPRHALLAEAIHRRAADRVTPTVEDPEDVQEGLRLLRERREWDAAEADRLEVQRLMYEQ